MLHLVFSFGFWKESSGVGGYQKLGSRDSVWDPKSVPKSHENGGGEHTQGRSKKSKILMMR